jgi:hypothetical protein
MPSNYAWQVITCAVILFACKKDHTSTPLPAPPPPPPKQVMLKDVVIQSLPSPHYHFEYDTDRKIVKMLYASGFNMYDVLYKDNKISEIRNNTMVNNDRLQYVYDNANNVIQIGYISESGVFYKRCFFTYQAQLLTKIEWQRAISAVNFVTDRTLTFTYLPDGNVQQITDHRPAMAGQAAATIIHQFEQYDNGVNADGFSLMHDASDHLLLLPAVQLQKNNPRKKTQSGTGLHSTVDYVYTYNNKMEPVTRTGEVTITSGPNAGQKFQSNTSFTYY